MLTVEADPGSVERRLAAGALRCPGCGGVLARWGWAVPRPVRLVWAGEFLGWVRVWLRPRRARCSGCGATQVLLPVVALSRRAYAANVIGAALVAAGGSGTRRVAAALAVPETTVRSWVARLAGRAEETAGWFTRLLGVVAVDPVMPAAAGGPLRDAVSAIVGAHRAVVSRWPRVGAVSPWWAAAAATHGALLSPSAPWLATIP
jgi:hypothetical protein